MMAATPTKPKKPVTGYLAFHSEMRKKLAASGTKLGLGETMREVAASWKALSDQDKKKYFPITEAEIKEHDAAMTDYQAAIAKYHKEREAAKEARKKKAAVQEARAVSPYTIFYNQQYATTSEELGNPKDLGKIAAAIAAKYKAITSTDKEALRKSAQEATAAKRNKQ